MSFIFLRITFSLLSFSTFNYPYTFVWWLIPNHRHLLFLYTSYSCNFPEVENHIAPSHNSTFVQLKVLVWSLWRYSTVAMPGSVFSPHAPAYITYYKNLQSASRHHSSLAFHSRACDRVCQRLSQAQGLCQWSFKLTFIFIAGKSMIMRSTWYGHSFFRKMIIPLFKTASDQKPDLLIDCLNFAQNFVHVTKISDPQNFGSSLQL